MVVPFIITFCYLCSQRVQKNEIFVDLLERLTVLVASNGNILRSHLDGSLIMRSFLGGHAGMYCTCMALLLVWQFMYLCKPDDGKVYFCTDCEKHKHRAVMHKKNGQICLVKPCRETMCTTCM